MPASRIVFALNDLIEEIGRLTPDAENLSGSLLLAPDAYRAVKAEVSNHFGGVLPEMVSERPSFSFKGFTVATE